MVKIFFSYRDHPPSPSSFAKATEDKRLRRAGRGNKIINHESRRAGTDGAAIEDTDTVDLGGLTVETGAGGAVEQNNVSVRLQGAGTGAAAYAVKNVFVPLRGMPDVDNGEASSDQNKIYRKVA